MNYMTNAKKAKAILESTPYKVQKDLIQEQFRYSKRVPLELIQFQLAMIDTFYSTNMSKRYFGIEDLAVEIQNLGRNMEEIGETFKKYAISPNKNVKVFELFEKSYGYHKDGKPCGHARSLISKYAYFASGFNFPIFDSIVVDHYHLFSEYLLKTSNICDYINGINFLNESSGIGNYNLLDNLLWMVGKIRKGNYSLILSKESYLGFVEKIPDIQEGDSSAKDKRIQEFVTKNISNLHKYFSKDLSEFIQFSMSLETERLNSRVA